MSALESPLKGTIAPLVAGALFFVLVGKLCLSLLSRRGRLDIPHVGEGSRRNGFSLGSRLRYYNDCKALFSETYRQFSKHGKTCVLPGIGTREEIILPSSATGWVASQPNSVLSSHESMLDLNQLGYILKDPKYILNPWPGTVLRRDMNRVLEDLAVLVDDEIPRALDHRLGSNTEEWKEIDPFTIMKPVIAQASSRFTVGLPLCRDEAYLRDSFQLSDHLVLGAGLMGVVPKPLKRLLAPVLTVSSRYYMRKVRHELGPTFRARMEAMEKPNPDDPPIHLDKMLKYAQANHPEELNLSEMNTRLALANLGSYHQTAIALANVIWNILGSDAEYDTIAVLREELTRVLAAHDGKWTKQAVAQMVRTDSVLRETLRVNAFGGRGLLRKVMGDNVRTPDGTLLPKGENVSVMLYGIHHDEDTYADPTKFDPFRFSRARENVSKNTRSEKLNGSIENGTTVNSNTAADPATAAFVSTGPTYLPFGHGKTACPGRFLLEFESKILLMHLLTNYDLKFPPEYNGRRPENKWIAEALFPVMGGKILIRRRSST